MHRDLTKKACLHEGEAIRVHAVHRGTPDVVVLTSLA